MAKSTDYVQYPIKTEIAELIREGGLRHGVYPKFVRDNRMTQEEAEQYIGSMYSARRRLEALSWFIENLTPAQRDFLTSMMGLLPEDQRKVLNYLLGPHDKQATIDTLVVVAPKNH